MLHLPIFTVSTNINDDDLYVLKIDKMEGFKDIELNFPRLSIKNDFMTFSFILKLFYENCDKEKANPFLIDFSLNDYFDFFEVVRNNRSSYAKTITDCIKRLSKLNMSFVRNDNTYICNLSSAIINSKGERQFQISLGENFLNFFKHDTDLIFNINLDNYKSLEKEFSKILYLYYITNLHKASKENVASFDKDLIFTRLQSASADRRKLQLIREANQELIDKKLIKSYSFSKSSNRVTKNQYRIFFKEKRRSFSRRKED